jgi:hypothetical protein
MAGVFISYRREDTKHAAARLHDRLKPHFEVFMDVASVHMGTHFPEAIDAALSRVDVLLALIGPSWATSVNEHGTRRLDDPKDYVARELRRALARGIPVVPVLVDGATMPHADDLPPDLEVLTENQATRLDHEAFDAQATQLTTSLKKLVGETNNRWRIIGLVAAVVIALGVVAAILLWPDPGPDDAGGTTTTTIQVSDRLEPDARLNPGEFITTPDGRHRLEMTAEGELVLTTDGVERWVSPEGPPGAWVNMQAADGNLVVYRSAEGGPVWATQTEGSPGAYLVVEDRNGSGFVAIYDRDGTQLWSRPRPGDRPTIPTVESTTATAVTTEAITTVPQTTVPGTTATPTSS